MNKISRRTFSQLAVAGTAATVLGRAVRVQAQTAPVIVGVLVTPTALVIKALDGLTFTPVPVPPGLVPVDSSLLTLATYEQLTSLSSPSTDEVFLSSEFDPDAATTSSNSNNKKSVVKAFVGGFKKELSGLAAGETLESLATYKGNKLYGLASQNKKLVRLIDVNINSANVRTVATLDPNSRFSQLAQSPSGVLYTTRITSEGDIELRELNPDTGETVLRSQLSIVEPAGTVGASQHPEGLNGLRSLVWSPSSELYALADPRKVGSNTLFRINVNTGEMTPLVPFQVNEIAFV